VGTTRGGHSEVEAARGVTVNVHIGDLVSNTGLVLDSLPRAIIIADRDARIVAWNKASTHLYRWSAEEVMGRSIHEIVAPAELRETARSIVDGAFAGQAWSGDVRLAIRTGETLRTFCFVGPLTDEHGSVVGAICAADDRSELHALSARASSLTDRLLLALSAGRLGTWQWDAATGVTTWDPMMERLFGLSPGEFTGTFDEWVARLHPDDRDDVLRAVQHSVETAEDYEVEHRVVHPDGTERWLHGRGKVLLDDDGVVIGTIGCSSDVTDRKDAESLNERRVVQAEAQVASERRHRERLEFLAELNDVAISAPSPRALMSQVANAAIPQLGDWCSLHFRPEPGEELVSVFAHVDPSKAEGARRIQERFPLDLDAPAGLGAVLRTGSTEFVPEFDPDLLHTLIEASGRPDQAELHAILDGLQLTSMITVPMITRRSVIGAIRFVSAESGRRYTQNDVALAEAAAGRVGESLVNAWLIDEQHRIAATLQAALLPPLIPQIDGVEIATRYWAAGALTDVGGDFYDVFPVAPNRWAIVIGDVCGTGPQAAAVTAIARHTIRAAATHGQSHQNVMRWVNEAIINSGAHTFCTAIYATLERRDDSTWTFTTAIGGHPRPILVSPGTRSRVLGTYGTLIGMVPNVEMSIDSYDLTAGDRIILYTDGVTDLPPPHGLSEDQLLELIDRFVDTRHNAEMVASTMGDDLEALMPIVERHDDVALLVLRLV
jgi:PAS domain S-box-containing protein